MKARTVLKWAIGVIALLAAVALAGAVWLFVAFYLDMEKGEQHRRQLQAELDSGRWDFGDQPALFAVAQGIVRNDPETIRTAAKDVSDLQAPGRDGATLLDFAVRRSWQHLEAVDAVKTLLARRRPELHKRKSKLLRNGECCACFCTGSSRDARRGRKCECSR